MEFTQKLSSPEKNKSPCVITGVFSNGKLPKSTKLLNTASGNAISKIIKKGDISGKVGQTLLLHNIDGVNAARVLLVGCGDEKELTEKAFKKIVESAAQAIQKVNLRDASDCLNTLDVADHDLAWKVTQTVLAFAANQDRCDQLKSQKDDEPDKPLKFTFLLSDKSQSEDVSTAIDVGSAIANGVTLAKNLGDLPGNVCTPTYLAEQAKTLDNQYTSLNTTILDERKMENIGMGALLSVSKGSREPAKFIIMNYKGGDKNQKPIVLVGKGLTFDAGGISIKPAAGMDEMKYDMCGGASVFGAMKSLCELELPLNVIGIVPSSENLPDGDANKPGDIVTSLSGQTIEILNTDAEGRLILCDALTYCEKYDPEVVIDIATLTGACVIALGSGASGMYSNHDELADALLHAGEVSGDRCWQMPLWDEYHEQLKSNFADMANVGGREAGSITAACFLSKYTRDYRWAHLDISGTAWKSGSKKGATGRPVPLLVNYLLSHVQ